MTAFELPKLTTIEDFEPPTREGFGAGRKAQPNPFEPVVAELAKTWSEEKKRSTAAIEFTYDLGTDEGVSDLRRIKTKISKACGESYSPGYEVRPKRHVGGRKYEGVCRFWLIPKVERKRKATGTAEQASDAA